jgi:23S rRNA pseudouridine1911/1915/1917 synthase
MATEFKTIVVASESSGMRLDKFVVVNCPGYSRTYLQKLIEEGSIKVNGCSAKPRLKLETGNRVDITIPPTSPGTLSPEAIPLRIVYEDNDLLVVDKPPGMTTHPSPGQTEHTLINAILSYYPRLAELGDTLRPGIVHRLDKDTSGIIIIAKNTRAQLHLINQFKERIVKKVYLTLVKGHLTPEEGTIEAPVGRHPGDRTKMAVVSYGRPARSTYKVVKYINGYTFLEVRPETGRTHQIRVHFSAIGYPVVGDAVYGEKSLYLKRQFLHAHRLKFKLPSTGEMIELKSELPEDLKQALDNIKRNAME